VVDSNSTYNVYNGSSIALVADSNYWGSANGPGTTNSGVVTATPFLTSDPSNVPGLVAPIFAAAPWPALLSSVLAFAPGEPVKPPQPVQTQFDPQGLQIRAAMFAEIEARDRAMHEADIRLAQIRSTRRTRVARR